MQEVESRLKSDVSKLVSSIEKRVKAVHLEAEDLLKKSRHKAGLLQEFLETYQSFNKVNLSLATKEIEIQSQVENQIQKLEQFKINQFKNISELNNQLQFHPDIGLIESIQSLFLSFEVT